MWAPSVIGNSVLQSVLFTLKNKNKEIKKIQTYVTTSKRYDRFPQTLVSYKTVSYNRILRVAYLRQTQRLVWIDLIWTPWLGLTSSATVGFSKVCITKLSFQSANPGTVSFCWKTQANLHLTLSKHWPNDYAISLRCVIVKRTTIKWWITYTPKIEYA